jgi:hypothetical protein
VTPILLLLAVVAGVTAASTACGVNMVFAVRASLDRAPRHRVYVPYVAGSIVGSAVLGVVLGGLGTVLHRARGLDAAWPEWAIAVLLLAAVVLGLRELGLIRIRLPQRASQLNSDGLSLGVSRRLFWFGAWLGAAVLTYSPYGGLHLLALAAIVAPSFELAVLLFMAFGLSRGLTVVVLGGLAETWDEAARLSDRIASGYRAAQLLTAGSLGVIAVNAVVALVA